MNRRALLAGAGLGALSLATSALGSRSDPQGIRFLAGLEQLKTAFYADAISRGFLWGESIDFAKAAYAHDRAHAAALASTLRERGTEPPPPERYDFRGTTSDGIAFARLAGVLERTATSVYIDELATAEPLRVRRQLAAILSVEAGQAAWVTEIEVGGTRSPVPGAFGSPLGRPQAAAIIAGTGFAR